jgi:hypothetical protein
MRHRRARWLLLPVLSLVVGLSLLAGQAGPAQALGAEVYRTDRYGNKTGTVVKVGSTGPACCCVWHGEGAIGYGVRVCYLPIA